MQVHFLDKVVDVLVVRSSWRADRGIVPQITEVVIKVIQLDVLEQIVVPAPQIMEEITKVLQLDKVVDMPVLLNDGLVQLQYFDKVVDVPVVVVGSAAVLGQGC